MIFRKVLEFQTEVLTSQQNEPYLDRDKGNILPNVERGQHWDWLLQAEGETGRTPEKDLALSKAKTIPEHLVFNTDNTTWNQNVPENFL